MTVSYCIIFVTVNYTIVKVNAMSIGERITARREELELKQFELADRIGVSKTTICKYERDVNIPNAEILAKLAEVLDTSADFLCGRTDTPCSYGEGWRYLQSDDKQIMDIVEKLSHDNKLKLSERALVMLEQQKK